MTAPTFTNLTANGASSATSFTTASVTPTGNRLILVSVHAYISTGSVQPSTPTVTGNGVTYTLVKAQDIDNVGTDRATLFVFRGMASTPTSGAVTISFGATTMTRCVWSVDQSDANVNTAGTNGDTAIYQAVGVTVASGTTASASLATVESKNGVFSAWGHQVNEATTPQSGWTELADVFPVTLSSLETQYKSGTDTAGSASWTTSSRAAGIVLEIAAPPVLLLGYNFDEASGNVLDVTGGGNGFALSGNTIRTASGHTNSGLTQTAAATQAGPSLTTALQPARRTWMTWIKFSAAVNGWILEFHNVANNTGVWGLLDISGTLRFRAKDSTNTAFDSASINRSLGTWQHIAATYDLANVSVYINGSLLGSTAMTTGIWTADLVNILDQTGANVIIDDVRFYDAALDSGTITSLMNTPVSSSGFTGTVAVTQANQTSSASGQLGYSGTSARTQANQTSTASGQLGYSGAAAATEAADTSTASGTFTGAGVSGNAAVTQAPNTSTATGQLGYSAIAAPAQAAQTSTGTGQLGYSATAAPAQANQASAASGQLGYSGSAGVTQAAQVSAASGTFTSAGSFSGSAAAVQAGQTSTASGQLGYSGTSTANQASNTSAASGTVVNPVTGTAAAVQAGQFSIANGVLRYSATGAPGQAANTSNGAGTVSGPVSGTGASVQANQTVVAVGTFAPLVTSGTASAAVGPVPRSDPGSMPTPAASAGSMPVPTATGG